MSRTHLLTLFLAGTLSVVATPASSCSPSFDYINRPLALKLKGDAFFIGEVKAVDEKEVTFSIITPGGPAKDKAAGETIALKREDHGTCGHLNFEVGEKWLYDGSDISFSSSQKLAPGDLKDGSGLEEVKHNLVSRLDPDYVYPRNPAKDDLPKPGTYSYREACSRTDQAKGQVELEYTLTIGEQDSVSKNYKVGLDLTDCQGIKTCAFTGAAPAYGYGEIVIPVGDQASNCSLLIQQLSTADEWPRLSDGETRVRLNDYRCASQITDCNGLSNLDSAILKRQ